VRATQGTRGVEGIAQRLDREGRLVLLLDDGREEALHSGVASLVRRSG
jgi:biotin-(acetyl-CoA carboxylase) ligase